MKKIFTVRNISFVLLGVLLLSGCSGVAPEPVVVLAAAADTPQAAVSVVTDLPVEVILPQAAPTETEIPSSPTPTRIEYSVTNDDLVVKVVGVERPHIVDLGIDANGDSHLIFNPGEGNMFLGLGIRIANKTGSDLPPMTWADVYLVNKYQEKWYPIWGVYKKTNTVIDPLTIEILEFDRVDPDFDPDARIYLGENGYLRLIFEIPRNNLYYYFGVADLPQIEINWRYY